MGSTYVLKLLKYFHPSPGNDKQSFHEIPVISTIALQYLAIEKSVDKTSFIT